MTLSSDEQGEVDFIIRTLRDIARNPTKVNQAVTAWAADEAAVILRNVFPIDYTTPPPPHEGMVSLFMEGGSHGEG